MDSITPTEAETILARYIHDGYSAVREQSHDDDGLREHIHFLGGTLYGTVTTRGLDAASAHRLVRRFFGATQACFEAERKSGAAEKRTMQ